ncbi:amidase [Bordetella sp. N]|uniref:amidase n=1 Tax=Bordetella sp. N TaxID=1746199 RepID=UPI000AAEB100|nr:amidase [Bordetella sp. N]
MVASSTPQDPQSLSSIPGLLQALRGYAAGTLTPAAYLAACADRADRCEPWLRSFVTRVPLADMTAGSGPLGGIPVGVKDIIATADLRTTNGSAMFPDYVPMEDAAVVATIKRLGGTVFGKTVTTEFAFRHPGPTANPFNPRHTPGGSSSGSAAAVGAGIVPLALGTQTMGSVVRPAAYCGIVGFKPSFGVVPREGVHPLSASLDHVGLMARHVDDVAYALKWLGDPGFVFADGGDLAAVSFDVATGLPAPAAAPRLALVRAPYWDRVDDEQNALLDAAVRRLRDAGATIDEVVLPALGQETESVLTRIMFHEAHDIYADLVRRHPAGASEPLKGLVRDGAAVSTEDYIAARRAQRRLRVEFTDRLATYDAVLTVAATGEAPEGLDYTGDAAFCAPWTMLGFPALSVPAGKSSRGLPLAIQLVAPHGHDFPLLRIAKWAEGLLAPTR